MKYVRVACLLLEVLLAESEGYKYLEEKNPLVFQIADLLRVEVEGVNFPSPPFICAVSYLCAPVLTPSFLSSKVPDKNGPRLLSPERVLKTMAREYFTMVVLLLTPMCRFCLIAHSPLPLSWERCRRRSVDSSS
jgi:hypothetical protein